MELKEFSKQICQSNKQAKEDFLNEIEKEFSVENSLGIEELKENFLNKHEQVIDGVKIIDKIYLDAEQWFLIDNEEGCIYKIVNKTDTKSYIYIFDITDNRVFLIKALGYNR